MDQQNNVKYFQVLARRESHTFFENHEIKNENIDSLTKYLL